MSEPTSESIIEDSSPLTCEQLNNNIYLSENNDALQQAVFPDDLIYEIISFHDDFKFIVMNCSLVCKQWFNVILSTCHHLYLKCANVKLNGRFLQNIESLEIQSSELIKLISMKSLRKLAVYRTTIESASYIGQLKQLTHLDVPSNNIGSKEAKFIGQLKELLSLNIANNRIGTEGAKYIGQLKQLTNLNISGCNIGRKEARYISKLKQLITLNYSKNDLYDEGAKYISQLKQLTFLNVCQCDVGIEGAKYISGLELVSTLYISLNDIGDEGAQYLTELKQLTKLAMRDNNINDEGVKNIGQLSRLIFLKI